MNKLYVILFDNEIPVMDIDPNSDYESPHHYTYEEAEAWIAANPINKPHFFTVMSLDSYNEQEANYINNQD